MSQPWMEEWWVDFVAGWVSGAAGVITCQPLDTVLTRFQATGGAAVASKASTAPGTTSGSAAAVQLGSRLAKESGVLALWRGSYPMIGVVPLQNALLMGGYGFGKRYSDFWDESDSNSNSNSNSNSANDDGHRLFPVFVGGCAGGVLQSFLMSPVEWIKIQQQTRGFAVATAASGAATATSSSSSSSSTLSHASTRSLLKVLVDGDMRLWSRGLTATLLRDGIPHGVWFASYEYCKTQMIRFGRSGWERKGANQNENGAVALHGEEVPSPAFYESVTVPLASGAFAATTAWAVGYPFDIIKTRIQAVAVASNNHPGVLETAKQLVAEADGRIGKGLYRGFGLKLLRSIPASMIGFLSYEVVSKALS